MPPPVFFQERREDGRRLQDPGRLGAPPCVGAKRRLNAPQALHTPLLLVMSRCWCDWGGRPAECQRFRCLSQSNHVTAQRSEIPCSWADVNKINQQQQKKKKGRYVSSVDVFVNPHWLSEFQAPMQYRRQCENTEVFLLVNKCWSWCKRCPLTHTHTLSIDTKMSITGFWKLIFFFIRKWQTEDFKIFYATDEYSSWLSLYSLK